MSAASPGANGPGGTALAEFVGVTKNFSGSRLFGAGGPRCKPSRVSTWPSRPARPSA